MGCSDASAWSPAPQVESFFFVYPVRLLVIDLPAFTPQQRVNAPHAEPDAGLGDLLNAFSHGAIVAWMRFVVIAGRRQKHGADCTTHTYTVARTKILGQLALLSRLQSFFLMTSWSMCLSRLRSATICFSRRFSASSCFRRRNSDTPSPPCPIRVPFLRA